MELGGGLGWMVRRFRFGFVYRFCWGSWFVFFFLRYFLVFLLSGRVLSCSGFVVVLVFRCGGWFVFWVSDVVRG